MLDHYLANEQGYETGGSITAQIGYSLVGIEWKRKSRSPSISDIHDAKIKIFASGMKRQNSGVSAIIKAAAPHSSVPSGPNRRLFFQPLQYAF
jgi:hypothetical protein